MKRRLTMSFPRRIRSSIGNFIFKSRQRHSPARLGRSGSRVSFEQLELKTLLADWNEQALLTASGTDIAALQDFGWSVAIDGDRAVIGMPHLATPTSRTGTAFVFERADGVWSEVCRLAPTDLGAEDKFGHSVALDGNVIVVGAPEHDSPSSNAGAFYVFEKTGATCSAGIKKTANTPIASSRFGKAVSIDGNTIVVGAPGTGAGAVEVWTKSGANVNFSQRFTAPGSDHVAGNGFGIAVDINASSIIVGADSLAGLSGAAFVFVLSGSTWVNQQKLTSPTADGGDQFGTSVAIDGNRAVVGAIADDIATPTSGEGAAHVFTRDPLILPPNPPWSFSQTLGAAPDANLGDVFGRSVDLVGDLIVVGAAFDTDVPIGAGAAYVFGYNGTSWIRDDQLAESTSPSTSPNADESADEFGAAVATDGLTIIVGAPGHNHPGIPDTGAAFVFVTNDPPIHSVPGPQQVNEDGTLVFSGASAISISDVDAGAANVQTALTSTNGTVNVTAAGSAIVSGNGTASVTITGSIADINATLASLIYQPNANYFGPASLTIHTNDLGNTGTGGPRTDTDSVSITVNPVNDAPSFTSGGNVTVLEDSGAFSAGWATSISVGPTNESSQIPAFALINDNNGLFATQPAISPSGVLTFVPASNASGSASVTVALTDNGGTANGGDNSADPVVFTIVVTPVNDPPSGTNGAETLAEDGSHTFTAADFGFTDPDDAPPNSLAAVVITTLPAAGTLTLNEGPVIAGQSVPVGDIGGLVFAPAANANGSPYTSFTFQVQDNGGGNDLDLSANAITINVTSVNDAPAGTNGTVLTSENTVYVFDTDDFGFTDPNDTPANVLAAVVITTLPGQGSLTLNGNAVAQLQVIAAGDIADDLLEFTPDAGTSGNDYATFTFRVQDDGGTANGGVDLDPIANTITIDVSPIDDNNAPQGTDNTISTNEDTAYTFASGDFGFSDPSDSPPDAFLAVKITALPGQGALTLNAAPVAAGDFISAANINAGGLKFAPDANENGAAYTSFTFQVQDDSGSNDLDLSPNTLTINVAAVNDAPVAADVSTSVTEDGTQSILVSGTDVETASANLTFTITSLPTKGVLTKTGGVAVQLNETFTGPQTFTFEAGISCDCLGETDAFTFSVTDRGIDSAPTHSDLSDSGDVDILFTAAVADSTAVITGNILRVGGTSAGDVITVDFNVGGGNLRVVINGTPTTLPNAGVTEVRAWGRSGNDDIQLIDWTQKSIVKGGAGNDLLLGGGGKDLIFGDTGNDLLFGSSGHDFLIGGDGVDVVFGNNGADILVAGELACDLTADMLRDISDGWSQNDESDGGAEDDTIDETVIDTDIDVVIGGFGSDWFIVSAGDIVLDWFRRFIDFDDRTIT
jgi:hypothetical protein